MAFSSYMALLSSGPYVRDSSCSMVFYISSVFTVPEMSCVFNLGMEECVRGTSRGNVLHPIGSIPKQLRCGTCVWKVER